MVKQKTSTTLAFTDRKQRVAIMSPTVLRRLREENEEDGTEMTAAPLPDEDR